MKTISITLAIMAAAISTACNNPGTTTAPAPAAPAQEQDRIEEQARPKETVPAERMLVSKGIIRSENEIKVFSRIEGQLEEVTLLEGRKVQKGETLFTLDDWELRSKVMLDESALEQAHFRMEEILVSQGFKRDSFDAVPENISSNARIKSGLNVCERELEISRERLSMASISAPVSGLVTGLSATSYAFVKPGETLCTIVDPKHLFVEFSILETELRNFHVGVKVDVQAIAYKESSHTAIVRSVGSVVGNDGMIKVEAALQDSEDLLPGMTAIVNL
ncbi:MAG: HlyD family efflux transporter periplasmic adaptor subunit [Bacteroidales bacterium]|nr:HlyD family efflux transporter periplasmic adaptor subunit [Bacteroidales bacterium]